MIYLSNIYTALIIIVFSVNQSALAIDHFYFNKDKILIHEKDGDKKELCFSDLISPSLSDNVLLFSTMGIPAENIKDYYSWVVRGVNLNPNERITEVTLYKTRQSFFVAEDKLYKDYGEHISKFFGLTSGKIQVALIKIDSEVDKNLSEEEYSDALLKYYGSQQKELARRIKESLNSPPPPFPVWKGSKDQPMPFSKAYKAIHDLLSSHEQMTNHLISLTIEVLKKRKNCPTCPPHIHLATVLKQWENNFGFSEKEDLLTELSTVEFGAMLRAKKPFDDMSLTTSRHGRDTHRIQWNCIMRAVLENPQAFFTAEELASDITGKMLVAAVYQEIPNFKRLWYKNINGELKKRDDTGPWLAFDDQSRNLWTHLFDNSLIATFTCPEWFCPTLQDVFPELGNR